MLNMVQQYSNQLLTYLRSRMSAADFQQDCEDFITACAIGAVLLLGWVYYWQAATSANVQTEDGVPAPKLVEQVTPG